jgi:hypothetical protein
MEKGFQVEQRGSVGTNQGHGWKNARILLVTMNGYRETTRGVYVRHDPVMLSDYKEMTNLAT